MSLPVLPLTQSDLERSDTGSNIHSTHSMSRSHDDDTNLLRPSGSTPSGGQSSGGFAPGLSSSSRFSFGLNNSGTSLSGQEGNTSGSSFHHHHHTGNYFGAPSAFSNSSSSSSSFRIPIVIRRIFRPPTLDFETAIWEILYLVISPTKVYKSLYYHKQTKNKWARDDPSFMILLSSFLLISALGWGLAYSPGFFPILKLMVYMVLVDFFAMGIVVATVGWIVANKFLRKDGSTGSIRGDGNQSWFGGRKLTPSDNTPSSSATNRNSRGMVGVDAGDLEWAYCFDVHCNSFLIIWLCLYVIQFLLLPLLTRSNWFCLFLGNTLYLFALCYYFVITFYGYNALPFLHHTELLLAPIPILVILYLFSLFGFNVVKTMGSIYFGIS